MDYEVLNTGIQSSDDTNYLCPQLACVDADLLCPNIACDTGGGGDTDSNCGNNFPCENPGLGCRSGCGAPSTIACPDIMSF